jgi:sucrose-6-phosphate hydrolase SacC (GH32 family)
MNIRNLDYECYLHSVDIQRTYQEDWLRSGYAPRGFYLKDFCLLKVEHTYHLFHIAGTPGVSCCLPGNEIWFGHATTRDFQRWETHEPCFYIDPASWDNGHVFAPYVISRDGAFWMFYTGCALDNTQRIGAATSRDLFDWRRASGRPVIRPEEYGWAFCPTHHGSACRDPHIAWLDGRYHMYYTAVTGEGRGCVARAWSDDLLHWHDAGPAYTYRGLNHCESSNLQELDGRYLLFFGGHHEYWSYVVSDDPYSWPDQEPIRLKRGITAMEVVERRANRWLVSYFKFESQRLFLGVVDWSEATPGIVEVETASQLVDFGP